MTNQFDDDKRKKMIEELKETMRVRGVNPEPYLSTILAYQKVLDGITRHEEIVVAMNVVEALAFCTAMKHAKFHMEGGKDERRYSDFN